MATEAGASGTEPPTGDDAARWRRSFETLLVQREGVALTVTVNRPSALNALSRLVLTELNDLWRSLIDDLPAGVRGVILTGAGGRAFVAGADIREMASMSPEEALEFGRLGQGVMSLIEAVPVPVIACVDGYALGGGCELAMACDYIFCTDRAVFGQPEVTLGLIPGFGGCVRLQRLVGPGRAREMIYTGRQVTGGEAERIGLANERFSSATEMFEAAARSLDMVATRSPQAVAICKATINDAHGRPIDDALAIELAAFREAFTTDDMQEGTKAFLEKREPDFSQRAGLGFRTGGRQAARGGE